MSIQIVFQTETKQPQEKSNKYAMGSFWALHNLLDDYNQAKFS
ncbi:hypothetical protein Dd586_2571 [Dickeya parazeae Ech586]|uniref:Uncharacterized protein n=1 Tax=Dickeya zeae (strain Ech586) TaxID=590409 RepID=D2C337_DICZ5|nr:hypothetical protein Dd586_2571 [Dickeya parazeae Ech586]